MATRGEEGVTMVFPNAKVAYKELAFDPTTIKSIRTI